MAQLTKFDVGDRVQIIGDGSTLAGGREGVIERVDWDGSEMPYLVAADMSDGNQLRMWYSAAELAPASVLVVHEMLDVPEMEL